jgi:hypothetical protein
MIAIKPHHFVDIVTAFGEGCAEFPPHPYGHAVHSVAKEILGNRDMDLRVEFGADDICAPCRHNINGLCDDTIDTSFRPQAPCSKREWNLLLDQRWSERLGLRQNDRLTARELCVRIRDCARDIDDIYREISADRTAERQANLQRGIAMFLDEAREAGGGGVTARLGFDMRPCAPFPGGLLPRNTGLFLQRALRSGASPSRPHAIPRFLFVASHPGVPACVRLSSSLSRWGTIGNRARSSGRRPLRKPPGGALEKQWQSEQRTAGTKGQGRYYKKIVIPECFSLESRLRQRIEN